MFRLLRFCFFLTAILSEGCTIADREQVCSEEGRCITIYEYRDETYTSYTIFTYGKYTGDSLPESYVQVRNRWRDGWECLLEWRGDTAIVYEPYGMFKEEQLNASKLKVVRMKDTAFYKLYYDKRNDLLKLGMDDY